MLKRVLTATVCLAILVPVLIFSDMWVFPAVLGLLSLIAVFEITGCVGVRRKYQLSLPTYLFAAFLFLALALHTEPTERLLLILFAAGYMFLFYIFSCTMLSRGNIKFSQAAELVSATVYILIGFLSLLFLRRHEMGQYLYLLVFIGAWMTDTGAYFIGVFFGRHKLIPEVSPKKTVEGAFGGVLGCVVGYLLYGVVLQTFFDVQVNFLFLGLLAVLISVVSELGDLIASYIKRERGIKDYGFLFPGHGGVMDRFDSVIAVAPVLLLAVFLLSDTLLFAA